MTKSSDYLSILVRIFPNATASRRSSIYTITITSLVTRSESYHWFPKMGHYDIIYNPSLHECRSFGTHVRLQTEKDESIGKGKVR